jgi:hypothetical protein
MVMWFCFDSEAFDAISETGFSEVRGGVQCFGLPWTTCFLNAWSQPVRPTFRQIRYRLRARHSGAR